MLCVHFHFIGSFDFVLFYRLFRHLDSTEVIFGNVSSYRQHRLLCRLAVFYFLEDQVHFRLKIFEDDKNKRCLRSFSKFENGIVVASTIELRLSNNVFHVGTIT